MIQYRFLSFLISIQLYWFQGLNALGVALIESLDDSSFSSLSSHTCCPPENAKESKGSWVGIGTDPYLEIDFGEVKAISSISTWGRGGAIEQYVTQYTLSYYDGSVWIEYGVFNGNYDHYSEVNHRLSAVLIAQKIRFTPITYNSYASMRVEVYQSVIDSLPDSAFSASSSHSCCPPQNAKASKGSWVGIGTDPYLEIDFGEDKVITSISTWGRGGEIEQYVTQYAFSYFDGSVWIEYGVFNGNHDPHSEVKHKLSAVLITEKIRFTPTTYNSYASMRVEVYESEPQAIINSLPNHSFSASSFAFLSSESSHSCCPPENAKVSKGSWVGIGSDDPYLEIDFGEDKTITSISTWGRGGAIEQYVTQYTFSYYDGSVWIEYGVLNGNDDQYSEVNHQLSTALIAQKVRFRPITYNSFKSMRVEVYESETQPIIDSLPDSSFSASPFHTCCPPESAKLSNNQCWASSASDLSSNDAHLQIDLGEEKEILSVSTWGRVDTTQWVTQYTLSYYDGNSNAWIDYGVFDGNSDANSEVNHYLNPVLFARFVRFTPSSYNNWKSMRVEVYVTVPEPLIYSLPDSSFSSLSSESSHSCCPPQNAKVSKGSWVGIGDNTYLQIDFGGDKMISSISTWGRGGAIEQYVTQYTLSYYDGSVWIEYGVFNGNYDPHSEVNHKLSVTLITQKIRFTPITYNSYASMRVEAYTPGNIHYGKPLINSLSDSAFSATSSHSCCSPQSAKLSTGPGWATESSELSSDDAYLQINLGEEKEIVSISTWGRSDIAQWVTQYTFAYYDYDSDGWIDYGIFDGNADSTTEVNHRFSSPLVARYIRFIPKSYNLWKSMRVEVYVSDYSPHGIAFEPLAVSNSKSWYEASVYCVSQYGSQLAQVTLSLSTMRRSMEIQNQNQFDTIWIQNGDDSQPALNGQCPTFSHGVIGSESCNVTLPFLCESKYKWISTPNSAKSEASDVCCRLFGTQLANIATDQDHNQSKALMTGQTAPSWIGQCSDATSPECSPPNDCLQMSADGTVSNECSDNEATLCNLKHSTRGVNGPVFGIKICTDPTLLDATSQSTMTLQYYDDTLQSFRCIFRLRGAEPDEVFICAYDDNAIQLNSYVGPHVVPRSITVDIAAFNTLSICGVSFIEKGYAINLDISFALTAHNHYAVIPVPRNDRCTVSQSVTVSVHAFESCGVIPETDTGINVNDLSSSSEIPYDAPLRRRLTTSCIDESYQPPTAAGTPFSKMQAAEAAFAYMNIIPNPYIAQAGKIGTAGAKVLGLFGGDEDNTQWISDGFAELHHIMVEMNECTMEYFDAQISNIDAQITALEEKIGEDLYLLELQGDVNDAKGKKKVINTELTTLELEMNHVHQATTYAHKLIEYKDALDNAMEVFTDSFLTQPSVKHWDVSENWDVYDRGYQIESAQLLPLLQDVIAVRFTVWMDWLVFNDFYLDELDPSYYLLRSHFRAANSQLLVKYLDLLWASFGYLDDTKSPIEAYRNIESRYKPNVFCEWIQLTEKLTDLPIAHTFFTNDFPDFLDIDTCPDQVFRYLKSKLMDPTNGYGDKYNNVLTSTEEIEVHYHTYPENEYELLWFPSYSDLTWDCFGTFVDGIFKNPNPSAWRTFSIASSNLKQIDFHIATHYPGTEVNTWIYQVNFPILLTQYFPSEEVETGATLCDNDDPLEYTGLCYPDICPISYVAAYDQSITTHCLSCNEGTVLSGLKFAIAGDSIVGVKALCRLQSDTYDTLLDYEIQTVSWNIEAILAHPISWSDWSACPIGTYISTWTFYYRPMATASTNEEKSNLHFHSKVACTPYITDPVSAAHASFQNEINDNYDIPNQHTHILSVFTVNTTAVIIFSLCIVLSLFIAIMMFKISHTRYKKVSQMVPDSELDSDLESSV